MAIQSLLFLSLSLFLFHLNPSSAQTPVKAGYWSSDSEFQVSNINSALFTHLFCAFADLNNQSNQVTIDPNSATLFSTFTQTVQQKNPNVKTLLSIGGGNSNSTSFAAMASQPGSRKSFIDSSIQLARSNGFHGLDLDWEYPETSTDMANLGTLLTEWRAAVRSESSSTGSVELLLTAAMGFSSIHDSESYPVSIVRDSLDWVNVMAYDFKGPNWSNVSTGAPAGLYDPDSEFSGSAGVDKWIGSGMVEEKMVLGLPLYGYAWKLVDAASHGIGAPADGKASGEGISSDDGSISYNQILDQFINGAGASSEYDGSRVTNYCYSGTTWIGYDDVQSIAAKVSYAKGKGLLGYFVWSVSGDDGNWVLCQTASQTWN
ncbi:hypothetical protein CKAN_02024300 [Cinnamomum micranthum f. kanehirae]|uniref:GH18 domain-containing protein n=1 Tax=Cinnamomum micranthum f. kanehirae TaxID=337451 RepID=A0A443PJZ7_9MAGN|nr:hypothetical protein CKAN_02024300 [Cinnamomum micranthum f. kanehirae]